MKSKVYIIAIWALLIVGCSSSSFIPTTDVCNVRKQYEDPLFQILVNGGHIDKRWYLLEDAVRRIGLMEERNICNMGSPLDITK